jgi:effector-binding domain-containing protein
MHSVSLSKPYDFMQVLNSIRKHYTKNEYFPKHILFTTIYLMQEQKLNPNKYSEKDINMRNFVETTEHDVHMHAKVQGLILYVFS